MVTINKIIASDQSKVIFNENNQYIVSIPEELVAKIQQIEQQLERGHGEQPDVKRSIGEVTKALAMNTAASLGASLLLNSIG